MTADLEPAVDDATFMENVREALGNGYDRLCARCGIGTAGDDMDIHERRCPEYNDGEIDLNVEGDPTRNGAFG